MLQKSFIASFLLVTSLIFPGPTFALGSLSFFIAFFISFLLQMQIERSLLLLLCLLSCFFCFLSILHMFQTGNIEEVVDLVRIMPLAVAALVGKLFTIDRLRNVIILVVIINLVCVYLVANGIASGVFDFLHARNLEESYGRHSGVFVNVATLGLFCLMAALFFINEFKNHSRVSDFFFLLATLFLMVLSGSKTALLLIFVFFIYEFLITLGKLRLNALSMAMIALVPLAVIFAEEIQEQFYVIIKIIGILESGFDSASSVRGRFDIWSGYFSLFAKHPEMIIYGVPVSVAETVSTTFDSDFVWVFVRFGVVGFVIWATFWIYCFARCGSQIASLGIIFISSFFAGLLVNFQLAIFSIIAIRYFMIVPRSG